MAYTDYCIKAAMDYPYAKRQPRNRFEFIAEAVLADLLDRRGIKWALTEVDDETRTNIVESMSAIVAEIIGKELPDPEPKWWRDV